LSEDEQTERDVCNHFCICMCDEEQHQVKSV